MHGGGIWSNDYGCGVDGMVLINVCRASCVRGAYMYTTYEFITAIIRPLHDKYIIESYRIINHCVQRNQLVESFPFVVFFRSSLDLDRRPTV